MQATPKEAAGNLSCVEGFWALVGILGGLSRGDVRRVSPFPPPLPLCFAAGHDLFARATRRPHASPDCWRHTGKLQ